MAEKYHDYKFRVKEMSSVDSIKEYHKIKVCSNNLDGETYLYSTNGGGNYSLYLQDRFFNFNVDSETKNIDSFEGDLNVGSLKFIKLKLPNNIVNAILSLDTKDTLNKGCGGYIRFDTSKVYYDKEQKVLQIGNLNPSETTYRFFDNGYAQIKKDNLSALMFTEIEL